MLQFRSLLFPFLFIIFFTTLPQMHAQSTSSVFAADTIDLKFNYYIKNGKAYPHLFGLFNLKNEMKVSPDAVIAYRAFERKRNQAFIFLLAGSALALWDMNRDHAETGSNSKGPATYVGLGFQVTGIYLGIRSIKSAKRAVEIRNSSLLSR